MYWFICILLLLFLSVYIIVSCYSVSSSIFCTWLHEIISNSNLYWRSTEEVTDKTSLGVAYTV